MIRSGYINKNKGKYNGPVWAQSGNFSNYMRKLGEMKAAGLVGSSTSTGSNSRKDKRASSYWLPQLAGLGKVTVIITLSL